MGIKEGIKGGRLLEILARVLLLEEALERVPPRGVLEEEVEVEAPEGGPADRDVPARSATLLSASVCLPCLPCLRYPPTC